MFGPERNGTEFPSAKDDRAGPGNKVRCCSPRVDRKPLGLAEWAGRTGWRNRMARLACMSDADRPPAPSGALPPPHDTRPTRLPLPARHNLRNVRSESPFRSLTFIKHLPWPRHRTAQTTANHRVPNPPTTANRHPRRPEPAKRRNRPRHPPPSRHPRPVPHSWEARSDALIFRPLASLAPSPKPIRGPITAMPRLLPLARCSARIGTTRPRSARCFAIQAGTPAANRPVSQPANRPVNQPVSRPANRPVSRPPLRRARP